MILYAHPDGRLEMAAGAAPAATLPIISGSEEQLVDAVAVLAELDDDGWRVPGLTCTIDGLARLNVLEHFRGRIRFRLAGYPS